ncbi:MAG: hypothetical protein EOM26_11125 [Alphaproteobacteria bacterium]|nr:hypothetical protein [Alphaproteobacteria bacterium]
MSLFPSDLPFFSLLQYAPRGTSELSRKSRDVVHAIKTDANRKVQGQTVNVIAHAARRAAEAMVSGDVLAPCFGPDVLLVPMPRSSLQKPGALWPSLVICEALMAQGLGGGIDPCLRRSVPVGKAAIAASGGRPDPVDHDESVVVERESLLVPERLTIVDDVITRGSSFVGVFPKVAEAFPGIPISCFALMRTISEGDIDTILDPVRGIITSEDGKRLRRRP